MEAWPSTLPQPLADTYREGMPDIRLVSETDSGIPTVRRKASSAPTPVSFSMYCDATQTSAFVTFFVTTVLGGTQEFTWTHPRTAAAVVARFAPSYEPPALTGKEVNMVIPVQLEILP